jgi:DNA-binding XRE family transcriptional regulator
VSQVLYLSRAPHDTGLHVDFPQNIPIWDILQHILPWGGEMRTTHSQAYRDFSSQLRQARKEAGLTQIEVARLLGRPQSFVSKCESGERRVDVTELAKFAGAYSKPLDFFIKPNK